MFSAHGMKMIAARLWRSEQGLRELCVSVRAQPDPCCQIQLSLDLSFLLNLTLYKVNKVGSCRLGLYLCHLIYKRFELIMVYFYLLFFVFVLIAISGDTASLALKVTVLKKAHC